MRHDDPFADLDAVIRGWDRFERHSGGAVVDFDLAEPGRRCESRVGSRREAMSRLNEFASVNDRRIATLTVGHRTALDALCGKRLPLSRHIANTLRCRFEPAVGELEQWRARLDAALARVGMAFGPDLVEQFAGAEPKIDERRLEAAVRAADERWVPRVAELAGVVVELAYTVEVVREDVYWSCWLDGSGQAQRLRINLARTQLAASNVDLIVLHELAGHALQHSAWSASRRDDPSFPATVTLHSPVQAVAEGLAEMLPLIVAADEDLLVARATLGLYVQEAMAAAHLACEASPETAERSITTMFPWVSAERAASMVADRLEHPILRSYLWAYPAGGRAWGALCDGDPFTLAAAVRRAYAAPCSLDELTVTP